MMTAATIRMLVIQAVTLWAAKLFFDRFFDQQETKWGRIMGIVLYMTYPYRVFVCMQSDAAMQAAVWALLPLYGWAVLGLFAQKDRQNGFVWRDGMVAALTLAAMGYADVRIMLITLGIMLLAAVCWKRMLPLGFVGLGCLLFAPGWYRLVKVLFTDAYAEMGISLQSIMPNGYRAGQFLGTYAFRDEHPGVGMGVFLCLVMGMWLVLVQGEKVKNAECKKKLVFFAGAGCMLMLLSTRYFPWDFVQRLGVPFLRLVGLFQTPAVFFGYACACLCVPAAMTAGRLEREENELLSFGIPMFLAVFSIGVCVYQCYISIL